MGDFYATALGKGLKFYSPEVVNVADNRLTKKGSKEIINKLNPSIKYLNLSQNQLDINTANELGQLVKTKALK